MRSVPLSEVATKFVNSPSESCAVNIPTGVPVIASDSDRAVVALTGR
jgi:ribosomal protein S1